MIGQRIRVLVADDSLTVRRRLCAVLEEDPGIDVVGEAENGSQVIDLCRQFRPDVITMDMMMPVMSGLAATEYIMAHFPTPILIVSSSTNRGELFKTYEALAAGAIDVLEKPDGDADDWDQRFRSTVKLVSRIKVITHPRARLGNLSPPQPTAAPVYKGTAQPCRVVGIGASTGGPAAIVDVLRGLPTSFSLPILLVLHIGNPFAAAFAEWLDGQTPRHVSYARGGEAVASAAGRVLMAPPDRHMEVAGGHIRLTSAPERHSCRPSVDVLFESMARDYGSAAAACLLTGMGRDGASGLLEIRRAGGHTVAQDEATSVIFGMPREAVAMGAAQRVLPIAEIGPALAALAPSRNAEPGKT
ncbi:MAG TPA: chemotaxis-specific protein-glutamate methyltransferase CheB [Burkholderiales bacterium]|nr:chemotaxis-specific protein-glutamate methyltransferase CheB [Burkholderiales bacterium]